MRRKDRGLGFLPPSVKGTNCPLAIPCATTEARAGERGTFHRSPDTVRRIVNDQRIGPIPRAAGNRCKLHSYQYASPSAFHFPQASETRRAPAWDTPDRGSTSRDSDTQRVHPAPSRQANDKSARSKALVTSVPPQLRERMAAALRPNDGVRREPRWPTSSSTDTEGMPPAGRMLKADRTRKSVRLYTVTVTKYGGTVDMTC